MARRPTLPPAGRVRPIDHPDAPAVLAANRQFYEAFEGRDFDAMSDLWEHSDRAVCTHPGWATCRGWAAVSASFFSLFRGPATTQFILTNEQVQVVGDTAWVSLDENLLGDQGGATLAAINLFVRNSGRWRMVVHAGSIVSLPIGENPRS